MDETKAGQEAGAHVMIDLETMGNGNDASITQIGAVAFDLSAGAVGDEFTADVLLASAVSAGLKLDASAITWWMGQDGAAREAWLAGQKTAKQLGRALHELSGWIRERKPGGVWSHGSTFDLPIVVNACRATGRDPGWSFRDARDTRTIFWLCAEAGFDPWEEPPVSGEVKHRAVDDARRQARAVIRAVAFLRKQPAPQAPPTPDGSVSMAGKEK